MHLVFGHAPHCATEAGGTCLQRSGEGNILPQPPVLDIGPDEDDKLLFNTGTREGFHSSNDNLYRAPAGSFSGDCQHLRGPEQQQEPRAGGGTPLCQVAGPGLITKVTYFGILPLPSLIFTLPMCGPKLMTVSRPHPWRNIWATTSVALNLPPTLPAPVGGEFAEDVLRPNKLSLVTSHAFLSPPIRVHLKPALSSSGHSVSALSPTSMT